MNFNLDDTRYEQADYESRKIECAVYKMKEAFDDGELTLKGEYVGPSELADYVASCSHLERDFLNLVTSSAKGVDCGVMWKHFWAGALDGMCASLVDQWMGEREGEV